MNPNQETIRNFYTAFANHDAAAMATYYHPDASFSDPAFGNLKGKEVSAMWKMLIERSKGNLEIAFSDIKAGENSGSAKWVAKYEFTQTKRKITNHIKANFEFRDGLIIRHTDDFELWKWSRQAFGLKGLLIGWTSFFKTKLQQKCRALLAKNTP